MSTLNPSVLFVVVLCSTVVVAKPPIREAPKVLDGSELGVGETVPDIEFTDLDGNTGRLSTLGAEKAVVFLMTNTGCPLCRRYGPTLAAIEDEYKGKGVKCVFVNSNRAEKLDRIRKNVETHGFQGPYVRDVDQKIIRALGAKTTTEAFVLDSERSLVYRGAVDDQYGFGYSRNEPRHTYLRDALDALLAGATPTVAATSAPGCELWIDDE